MKTNLFVTFASVLLVVVYLLVMRIDVDTSTDISNLIPGNTLFYFEQRNGADALARLVNSPLGKKFAALDLLATGAKIGLSPSALEKLSSILTVCKNLQHDRFVNELLGKRFAVAIMPPADNWESPTLEDFVKTNSVIVSEPRHNAELLEFLAENYGRYNDSLSIETVQYGNHHIKRINSAKERISLVNIAGHFIVSFNEKQVRECIDTYDGEIKALGHNHVFLTVRKDFDKPARYLYIPIDSARVYLKSFVKDHVEDGREILLKELETTEGFSGFGYGAWNRDKKMMDKIVVKYDADKVNDYVKNYLKIDPVKSSMLSLTTNEPMVYYWSNTFDFKNFLLYIDDETKSDPRIVKYLTSIKDATGKSAEEILSFLGEEVSLVLEPGPEENYFPFPLGLVFAKVKNKNDLDVLLQLFLQKYEVPVKEIIYGPVRYVYWTLSPQDGLKPLYGFWQDRFFFGNSSKLLKKIVDLSAEKFSLLKIPGINKLDPGLTNKNNSITYFNNVQIIKVMQMALGLIGPIVSIEDREAAEKIRIIIEEIINPLLEGASMYERSVTRSYFTADRVIVDSITDISSVRAQ